MLLTACGKENNEDFLEEDFNKEVVENEENDHDRASEEVEESPLDLIERDPSVEILVNKEYHLSEDFVPEDLVRVSVDTILENEEVNQMRKVAADALAEMFAVAEEHGLKLYARSGYRSYYTQASLFDGYVSNHGLEKAERFSARPGQSEHQTGLVMDITAESVNYQLNESFGETEEGKWVADNAHRFGFIIRYPKGKEDITQYIYEPWHLRYIGRDLAALVFDSGLTYEEFIVKEGILDEVRAQEEN